MAHVQSGTEALLKSLVHPILGADLMALDVRNLIEARYPDHYYPIDAHDKKDKGLGSLEFV